MRQFGNPNGTYHNFQPYHHFSQQPFLPSQNYNHNYWNQPMPSTPFELFAKPKQPQDWYANKQDSQVNFQQTQAQQNPMSQFQDQQGQINLDKVLTTVNQIASTYHQVSPIIKQFGSFMKTFR